MQVQDYNLFFQKCPSDVLACIALNCNPQELCKLAQVSHRWRTTVQTIWEDFRLDTKENRIFLAKILAGITAKANDAETTANQVIEQMTQRMRLEVKEAFIEKKSKVFKDKLLEGTPGLIEESTKISAEVFKVFELKVQCQMYHGTNGQALLRKANLVAIKMMPYNQSFVISCVEAVLSADD